MAKSQFPYVGNSELQLNPRDITPEIAEAFIQAFSRIMAYDEPNQIFRFLRTDSLGRLAVANNNITAGEINANSVSVVAGATQLIFAANPNRISFGIITSDTFLYFGTKATAPNNQVSIIPANSLYTDTEYQGDVYLNNTGTLNQFVRYYEVQNNG